MNIVVTFGEIMGRISPRGFLRFKQALPGDLKMTFAGAEANVAASIAILGGSSRFITALPDNDIAEACIMQLKGLGVDMSHVRITERGRLGLYFVETGANQRPGRVVYDRKHTSISLTDGKDYEWDAYFKDARWFHITGITPALSKTTAEATLIAVRRAKANGISVSCDLNFRSKLWRWDEKKTQSKLAGETMRKVLPYIDVLIGNEEDAANILGIHAGDTNVQSGKIEAHRYIEVAEQIAAEFKNLSKIAITLRESISASNNNWGAMLYDTQDSRAYFAPLEAEDYKPYAIRNIVDRVGAGDSFAAGLIYALCTPDLAPPQHAVQFATAASCLAHSIQDDYNFTTRAEIEALLKNGGGGRVVR